MLVGSVQFVGNFNQVVYKACVQSGGNCNDVVYMSACVQIRGSFSQTVQRHVYSWVETSIKLYKGIK